MLQSKAGDPKAVHTMVIKAKEDTGAVHVEEQHHDFFVSHWQVQVIVVLNMLLAAVVLLLLKRAESKAKVK